MFGSRWTVIGAAVVVSTVASTSAKGALLEDWNPPPWQRFTPGTTFQEWDFNSDIGEEGTPPDGTLAGNYFNQDPENDVPLGWHGTGVEYGNGGYTGTFNQDSSYLDFYIPNWVDDEPIKYLWIQIHGNWGPSHSEGPVFVNSVTGYKGNDKAASEFITSQDNDAVHLTVLWAMQPNPDYEYVRIQIPEGAFVGQVVIDTISFPTPGAVSAFGLVGVAALRRRR